MLVGFAAETERLLDHAREKMARKNLDLLVANDVSAGVFGSDRSTVHILEAGGVIETLTDRSKMEIAGKLLDHAMSVRKRSTATAQSGE